MPDYPVPRSPFGLERVPRRVARNVDAAHGDGLVGVARIRAAALVTHTALHHAGRLSLEEGLHAEQTPFARARYKAIVDQFTGIAVSEISALAWVQ